MVKFNNNNKRIFIFYRYTLKHLWMKCYDIWDLLQVHTEGQGGSGIWQNCLFKVFETG